MIEIVLLSFTQLLIILLFGHIISIQLGGKGPRDTSLGILISLSILHIVPIISFLLVGDVNGSAILIPIILYILVSIFFFPRFPEMGLRDFYRENYLTTAALIAIVISRILTIPEDDDVVRGDIVSHIPSILEFGEGLLGYPAVSYPRGFHGFFLVLSFGQEPVVVSKSVLITIMVIGWSFYSSIARRYLSDSKSAILILLSSGVGFIGLPDGLIRTSGWWLVRQSNIQPEISAWMFTAGLLWMMTNRSQEKSIPKLEWFALTAIVLALPTTNPFFILTCSPLIIAWNYTTIVLNKEDFEIKNIREFRFIFAPLVYLAVTAIYISIFSQFDLTEIDVWESPDGRDEILRLEFGEYHTDGLTVNTIVGIFTPKLDHAKNLLGMTTSLSSIMLFCGMLLYFTYARFRGDMTTFSFIYPLATLNILWIFGIPAPTGSHLVRTEYPLYAFGGLMLIPIVNQIFERERILPIFCFFLLCLDSKSLDFLLVYDYPMRIFFASIGVIIGYYSFDLINKNSKDYGEIGLKIGGTILLGFSGLTYWIMFNIHHYHNPDIGVLIIFSLISSFIGVWLARGKKGVLQYSVSTGIVIGLFLSQGIQIYSGNNFVYSLYCVSFFIGFILSHLQNLKLKKYYQIFDLRLIVVVIFIANVGNHFHEPSYITALMTPAVP